MNWWRRLSWVGKILLPVNVLLVAATAACLEYPVFRLAYMEVDFADGREVPPELFHQIAQTVAAPVDSNLLSLNGDAIAESILQQHDDLVRVDVRMVLPDRILICLHAAQSTIWWSARDVLPVAGDGRSMRKISTGDSADYPVCFGRTGADQVIDRWRAIEFYQRLIAHDPRWADVISQISNDPAVGWVLVLNGGAEHVILGKSPDIAALNRVARFLESVPESAWARGTIDARFGGRIVVAPPDSTDIVLDTAAGDVHSENLLLPVGGEGIEKWTHENR